MQPGRASSPLISRLPLQIQFRELSFGSFGQVGTVRKYVLQQGTDASFTVDGMSMTSSTNTVTTAIQGVTLNLLGADPNTTLTVNVGHDTQGIESEINAMISAYNSVMSYVNTQNVLQFFFKYNGRTAFRRCQPSTCKLTTSVRHNEPGRNREHAVSGQYRNNGRQQR